MLRVEVVFALPDRHESVEVRVPQGATLADAVAASGLAARHPDLGATSGGSNVRMGVFGTERDPDSPAADGDRIELYRPLAMDPKEARRLRAEGKT